LKCFFGDLLIIKLDDIKFISSFAAGDLLNKAKMLSFLLQKLFHAVGCNLSPSIE
jgi:anti-anti-sigma regulatory factor